MNKDNMNMFDLDSFFNNSIDNLIFFGCKSLAILSPLENNINNLKESSESLYVSNPKLINNIQDYDNRLNSLNYLNPLNVLGNDYNNVYITYNPSYNLDYCNSNTNQIKTLENPLIKKGHFKISELGSYISEITKNEIVAIGSGRRSSIIFIGDKAYRLKGCGNLNQGFISGNVSFWGNNHKEIFGCQFKSTCLREQYITEKINLEMKKHNINEINIPNGFWKYTNNENRYLELGLKNEFNKIDKYCGIFLTKSEKRLGENFFGGLNILLNQLLNNEEYLNLLINNKISTESDNKSKSEVLIDLNLISKEVNNMSNDNNEISILFNDELLSDNFISAFENYKEDEIFKSNKCFNLRKYLKNSQTNKFEKMKEIENSIFDKIKDKLFCKFDNFQNILKFNCEKLKNNSKKILDLDFLSSNNLFYGILNLLSQLSYEVGKIKKIMDMSNLNWGTYDYHSNTHLDNFVLTQENENNNLLGCLDFDLAFFRENFICDRYLKESNNSDSIFYELLITEQNNLTTQLAGFNTIENIDVNILDINVNKKEIESLKNLILENIHYYFKLGYNHIKNDEINEIFKEYKTNYQLVRIILLMEELS